MPSSTKLINADELVKLFNAWPPNRQIEALAYGIREVYASLADAETADRIMQRFTTDCNASADFWDMGEHLISGLPVRKLLGTGYMTVDRMIQRFSINVDEEISL